MKGAQFLGDEEGQRTAVVIDLKNKSRLWEDLFDSGLVKARENEPRESLASVQQRLSQRRLHATSV